MAIFDDKLKQQKILTSQQEENLLILNKKNVYCFFQEDRDIENIQNFIINNWIKVNKKILNELRNFGASLWINNRGDLCYRLNYLDEKILISSAKKISLIFTNLLLKQIELLPYYKEKNLQKPIGVNNGENIILLNDLHVVKDEEFSPYFFSEFYAKDNATYRNLFKPTQYLISVVAENTEFNKSIILQYIYYLSGYEKERFRYIMSWLAAFFKNLNNKSNIPLVLVGDPDSGKEILFDIIIRELFGHNYCKVISEKTLQKNDKSFLIENTLFYNIDNIKDDKNKAFLEEILYADAIDPEIKNQDKLFTNYGQSLITIEKPILPYIDYEISNYTVFKINDNIEDMYIEEGFFENISKINLDKSELITFIKNDLHNFALILKAYSSDSELLELPFKNDDKKIIVKNFKDKIRNFSYAIINKKRDYFKPIKKSNKILYDEILEDFEDNKVKQRNLLQSFTILYSEEEGLHSRTLMSSLRKQEEYGSFFLTSKLNIGKDALKYWQIE